MWSLVVVIFLGSSPSVDPGSTVVTTIPAFESETKCSEAAKSMNSSGVGADKQGTWMTVAKCVPAHGEAAVLTPNAS